MILPMMRVELIGRRDVLPAALELLQARAVLELRPPGHGIAPATPPPAPPEEEDEARVAAAVDRIDALLARLPPVHHPGPAEPLPPPGTGPFTARLDALEQELGALEARRGMLAAEREATERFAQLVVALAPLGHGLDPELEPEVHGLLLRTDPAVLALLEGEVRRLAGGACEVKSRPLEGGRTGVLIVVPRAHGRALSALLSGRGVEEVTLPSTYAGRPLVELLLLLSARQRALPGELDRADGALAALAAAAVPSLQAARRAATWALERRRAVSRCGGTRFAFVVSGYVPAERVAALRQEVAARFADEVAVFARPPEPAEWEDVPVVIRNRRLARPFARLLALVPLPRYGSVDPTPWMAFFFPLFFGLVLGDLAFGLVGAAVALVARRARWGGEAGRDLAEVALWCCASAALFGLLYGEALGELGAHAGLRPILMDRRHAMMSFLALSLAVGAAHVVIGMILGVAGAVRARRRREATGRVARLLLLLTSAGAAAALLGPLPRAALLPLAVTAALSLAVAVAAEGPLAALDVVLGLGNVLSYSRLMALGLASVMLAEVANRVATTLQPAAAGLALGVLLHAVNFSLGLIGPTIAALRLHYVEFFEKFYDEGGFPFRPFGLPAERTTVPPRPGAGPTDRPGADPRPA